MSRLAPALCLLVALLACAGRAGAQTTLVQQARAAAHADRNRDAADLFDRALLADSTLRRTVLRELADQLTYSERAGRAIPLYHEVLAFEQDPQARRWTRLGLALALSWTGRHRESVREYGVLIAADPDDVDARLGRARVLAWQGRLGDARGEYLRILAAHPNTPDAQRELARVQWWRGRPRDAQKRLRALAQGDPHDADSRLLLAEVQSSLGRPDAARAGVDDVLARYPGHGGATALLRELAGRGRPTGRVQQYASEQSDGLDIRVTSVEQRFRPGRGRSDVEARYELHDYAPEVDGESLRIHRPGVYARRRLGDGAEVNASAHAELIRAGSDDRAELSYDAWATFWPHDVLRTDVSVRRATFDNLRSLRLGITGTYAGLSADFTPTEKTRLTARSSLGRISDGNRRRWGQAEAERQVWREPRILAGGRFTALDFSESTGNGYFEPQDYRSGVATLRAYDRLGSRLWWDVEGTYGREDTRGSDPKSVWSAGARAAFRASARTELELRYNYFSSLADVSGGFARGSLSAAVRYAW
jgi:tetratricopeptide (TPR) repeat protein